MITVVLLNFTMFLWSVFYFYVSEYYGKKV